MLRPLIAILLLLPTLASSAPMSQAGSSPLLGTPKTAMAVLSAGSIPDNVTSIGEEAFFFCSSLMAITENGLNPVYSSMGGVMFDENQTTLMVYPSGKAGSYTIPDNVTNIGYRAFAY
jgi:hypothetical protein